MTTVSLDEWNAKGRELFGPDQATWRFACPICKRESSLESVRAEFPDQLERLRELGARVECECLGRYILSIECDWCAYGLFAGPVFVTTKPGEKGIPCFDFAGLPFTGKAA